MTGLALSPGVIAPAQCSLSKSAVQSVLSQTFTPITFDVEDDDPNGLHSAGAPSRIVLTQGIWIVGGNFEVTGLSDQKQAIGLLAKNGVNLTGRNRMNDSSAAGSGTLSPAFTRRVKADVDGDYVELIGYHDQGAVGTTPLNATVNCHFWAVKIGPLV